MQVLSRSATREATHIQSLLNKKSCPALLLVNQTYTKMLNCFIIFFLQLSKKFYFALYVALFVVKKWISVAKITPNQQLKAFKCPFLTWTKHAKQCLQKTFKFGSILELTRFTCIQNFRKALKL